MDKTIQSVPSEHCTGCGACVNRCPQNAISMEPNHKGFLMPVIQPVLCTNCGLCSHSCPVLNLDSLKASKQEVSDCYAMMAEDSIRKTSSSGGMFSILANFVLEQNGLVCGAAYSDDYMSVEHIVVDNKEDLKKLRGSKYVQSCTNLTFRTIEAHLKTGGWALYTGTPCQIAGIRAFLKKDYDNFITADILCHGTPSPKVYQKYLLEIAAGRHIEKVDFRDKTFQTWGTHTSLRFEGGEVYQRGIDDEYWRAFLGGLSTRKSCGTCPYASESRMGDFTLGDAWGIESVDVSCNDQNGTTLLLVNTPKAKRILAQVSERIMFLKKISYSSYREVANHRNPQLLHPTPTHWAYDRFFRLLEYKPFRTSFYDAVYSKYDVGIMGWWFNPNYGATLTYYALNRILRKMGLSVLMISKCTANPNYSPNYNAIPYRFAAKYYDISKQYTAETIHCLAHHCKAFISGSDQLFNPLIWDISGPEYALSFGNHKNKLISYASSFGNEFLKDPHNIKTPLSYWLRRLDAVSVRESYGVDICRETFGIEATKVMDPVFLCDVEEFEKLAEASGKTKTEDYFLSFILDPTLEKRNLILSLSDKLNLPYTNLLDADHYEENNQRLNLDNSYPNADVEDWVFYYKNADFVLTDSFHGTCFAIIFRKKFISLANYGRGVKRFESILEEAGLSDRLVWDIEDIKNRPYLFEEIDYDAVYERLDPKIQASLEWLKNAVTDNTISPTTDFQAIDYAIGDTMDRIRAINEIQNRSNHEINLLHQENEQLRSELQELRSGLQQQLSDIRTQQELNKHGWLIRKIRGGIQCYKDNGLRYTWNHFWEKVKNKLKPSKG